MSNLPGMISGSSTVLVLISVCIWTDEMRRLFSHRFDQEKEEWPFSSKKSCLDRLKQPRSHSLAEEGVSATEYVCSPACEVLSISGHISQIFLSSSVWNP